MIILFCIRDQIWASKISSSIVLADNRCLSVLMTHKVTSVCTLPSFVSILVKEIISAKL
nr:MAG TPA: hypothetical protein [Bacteriophage sp.]